jgi:hypothetical protein
MSLSFFCAYLSLIGFFFYGCLLLMVYNGNEVLLLTKTQGPAKAGETQTLLL